MSYDDEKLECIMRLCLFEELLLFLRDQIPQDANSYAVELFTLQLMYQVAKEMIEKSSNNNIDVSLVESKNIYIANFKEIVKTITSAKVKGIEISGIKWSEPEIQNSNIQVSDPDEFEERLKGWKDFLVGSPHHYDVRLPGLIDALKNFFFTGYPTGFICVSSKPLSHQFRLALATQKFTTATGKWPTVNLIDPQKKVQAFAKLQPDKVLRGGDLSDHEEASQIEIMKLFAARMNDLTVDVFDIQWNTWFKNSNSAGVDMISEDEFLEQRGLKKHKRLLPLLQ